MKDVTGFTGNSEKAKLTSGTVEKGGKSSESGLLQNGLSSKESMDLSNCGPEATANQKPTAMKTTSAGNNTKFLAQ